MDLSAISRGEAAKCRLDLYFLAGQSNASGSSKIALAPDEVRDHAVYENVRFYYDRTDTDGTERCCHKDFCAVREGLGNNELTIGPELGMARFLDERYAAPDRKALIVKCAAGGTSLRFHDPMPATVAEGTLERYRTRGSWYPSSLEDGDRSDPNRPTGYLVRKFKAVMTEVYEKLLSLGFLPENVRFCALCWMQGETDRLYPDLYLQLFPLFAAEMREHLSRVTGRDCRRLPIVMGEISETFFSADRTRVTANRAFIACQHKLTDADPSVSVIPTGFFQLNRLVRGENVPIGTDNMHWSYADMLAIGEMFGESAYRVSHPEERT